MMTAEERAEWLRQRHSYVTASDVASCMGLNKYKSRAQLLAEKVAQGEGENLDGIAHIMAGRYLEKGILEWHVAHRAMAGGEWSFADGFPLTPHPSGAHLAATPDAIVTVDGVQWVTEVKNVGKNRGNGGWGVPMAGQVNLSESTYYHSTKWTRLPGRMWAPPQYWIQLQAQMSCLGIPRGRIVVCFGGQARADLDFRLDTAFESRMLEEVECFWAEVEEARACNESEWT